jgi:hypothetical protein
MNQILESTTKANRMLKKVEKKILIVTHVYNKLKIKYLLDVQKVFNIFSFMCYMNEKCTQHSYVT